MVDRSNRSKSPVIVDTASEHLEPKGATELCPEDELQPFHMAHDERPDSLEPPRRSLGCWTRRVSNIADHQAPERREGMRFAVIGAGVIGALHAETIAHLQGAELTAVVDVHPERARSLAGRYRALGLTSLEEALGRSDVEAVAICTPSGHHADLVEKALAAGKHVVVEKPLDVSLEAAYRVAAAERASRQRFTA